MDLFHILLWGEGEGRGFRIGIFGDRGRDLEKKFVGRVS